MVKLRRDSRTYRTNGAVAVLSTIAGILSVCLPVVGAYCPPIVPIATGLVALANLYLREVTSEPLAPLNPGSWIGRSILVAFLFPLALSSCAAPGGQGQNAGVVASVTIGPEGAGSRTAVFRYDGNTLVAWGAESYVAEIYVQATGLPLLIRTGAQSVAIVHRRDPEFLWQGRAGESLPDEARLLFRPAEISLWGLAFVPAPPPVVDIVSPPPSPPPTP